MVISKRHSDWYNCTHFRWDDVMFNKYYNHLVKNQKNLVPEFYGPIYGLNFDEKIHNARNVTIQINKMLQLIRTACKYNVGITDICADTGEDTFYIDKMFYPKAEIFDKIPETTSDCSTEISNIDELYTDCIHFNLSCIYGEVPFINMGVLKDIPAAVILWAFEEYERQHKFSDHIHHPNDVLTTFYVRGFEHILDIFSVPEINETKLIDDSMFIEKYLNRWRIVFPEPNKVDEKLFAKIFPEYYELSADDIFYRFQNCYERIEQMYNSIKTKEGQKDKCEIAKHNNNTEKENNMSNNINKISVNDNIDQIIKHLSEKRMNFENQKAKLIERMNSLETELKNINIQILHIDNKISYIDCNIKTLENCCNEISEIINEINSEKII